MGVAASAQAGAPPPGGRECYSHLRQDPHRDARGDAELAAAPGPTRFCRVRPSAWLVCSATTALAIAAIVTAVAGAATGWKRRRSVSPKASIQASETLDSPLTEWEVAFEGAPRVESLDAYWSAVVLDRKKKGTALLGRKDGPWLHLACEPGFMRIQLGFPAVPMLKERGSQFVKVHESRCQDSGKHPITRHSECERAKAALGLVGGLTGTVAEDMLDGCQVFLDFPNESFLQDGDVRFLLSDGHRPSAMRHEICYSKSKTCRSARTTTVTTTMTATTTSTTTVTSTVPYLVCSWAGEDCRTTKCCNHPGMSCFAQDSEWATCSHTCARGVRPGDEGGRPWSCNVLGGSISVEDLLLKCRWPGQDCSESKCCLLPGQLCYRKNAYWASCFTSCNKSGNNMEDDDSSEQWDCAERGVRRPAATAVAPAPAPGASGTTLFCFTTPASGKEWQLVNLAEDRKAGVAACDDYLSFGRDPGASVVEVWQTLRDEGQYKKHDFTVKVDPDVVFFPDRLRQALKKLSPPKDASVFLKPTSEDEDAISFFHVLSRAAVGVLLRHGAVCAKEPDIRDPDTAEGVYLQKCMATLAAGEMEAGKLVIDKSYDTGEESPDMSWCDDSSISAFRVPTRARTWKGCFDAATPAGEAQSDAGKEDAKDGEVTE